MRWMEDTNEGQFRLLYNNNLSISAKKQLKRNTKSHFYNAGQLPMSAHRHISLLKAKRPRLRRDVTASFFKCLSFDLSSVNAHLEFRTSPNNWELLRTGHVIPTKNNTKNLENNANLICNQQFSIIFFDCSHFYILYTSFIVIK